MHAHRLVPLVPYKLELVLFYLDLHVLIDEGKKVVWRLSLQDILHVNLILGGH